MPENSAKNLDKLLLKDKLNRLIIWAVTGICVFLFGLFLLGFSSDGSEKVVGEVTSTHTRMHEAGHTLYLMVKIPESINPVKVRLPKGQLIKKGAKIEINQINTLWFGKSRFSFSKYVE
jgi:hypothetical protein